MYSEPPVKKQVLGEDSEFLSQSLMTHVFWFAHVCAMLLV
jgi:hypothetical protein